MSHGNTKPKYVMQRDIFNLQILWMIINIDKSEIYINLITSKASNLWMNRFWSNKILMIWVIRIIKEVIHYTLDQVNVKELVLIRNRNYTLNGNGYTLDIMINWFLHLWMERKKYVLLPKSLKICIFSMGIYRCFSNRLWAKKSVDCTWSDRWSHSCSE